MKLISKTKYLDGLKCPKLLWHKYNAKDLIPAYGESTLAIFEQGHTIGKLAQSLFPNGINLEKGDFDIKESVTDTLAAIKKRKPMFEAAFEFDHAYARVDILVPVGKEKWDIIEVKSTTDVKEVHCIDLAIQKYILLGCGLKIRKCILMHINNKYIRKGEIDPAGLLTQTEVTGELDEFEDAVQGNLEIMRKVIQKKKSPQVDIGPHCSSPYGCPMMEICWDFLPHHNVTTLFNDQKKGNELLERKIYNIEDIPADFELKEKHLIQLETIRTGE